MFVVRLSTGFGRNGVVLPGLQNSAQKLCLWGNFKSSSLQKTLTLIQAPITTCHIATEMRWDRSCNGGLKAFSQH